MSDKEIVCRHCEETFNGHYNRKYCSQDCRDACRRITESPNARIVRECQNCGKELSGDSCQLRRLKYCSVECMKEQSNKKNRAARWPRKCPNCGKIFGGDDHPKGRYIYCSDLCHIEYNSKKRSPNARNARKCPNCGKVFGGGKDAPKNWKYCSAECRIEYNRKKNRIDKPEKNHQCLQCGKELTRKQVWRDGKYCSRKCFADGTWGKPVRGSGGIRNPAFTEALKLRRSGLTQAEIARFLGVDQGRVSGWFIQYGTEKILIERVCLFCGQTFDGKVRRSKYCSQSCSWRANYLNNHPDMKQMRFDPDLRLKALEMYWGGLEGTPIAGHLEVSVDTVHSWIHDFGHLRKRRRDPEIMKLLPLSNHRLTTQAPYSML